MCASRSASSSRTPADSRLVGDGTGPVRAPLLELDDAALHELGSLVEIGSPSLSR
jgi:hypothetical protein